MQLIEANSIVETVSESFDIEVTEIEDSPSRPKNVEVRASKAKSLKIDVETRWNSAYTMIESMIQLESRITTVLFKAQKRAMAFNDKELGLMKKLYSILKPFYDATLAASSADDSTKLVFELLQCHSGLDEATLAEADEQTRMIFFGKLSN